jgi:hypothetical protein
LKVKESKVNPWVRANQEQFCDETLELIPRSEQERYEILIAEIGAAATALNEIYGSVSPAQERLAQAYDARDLFFEGHQAA